jgi:hypothetical protein
MCAEDTEGVVFGVEEVEEAAEFPPGQVGARCSVQNKDSVLGGCLVAIDETFDASANLICLFLSLHLSA